jgi:hypothetical protein
LRGNARNLRHVRLESLGWGLVRHSQFVWPSLRSNLSRRKADGHAQLPRYCSASQAMGQPTHGK